MTYWFMRMKQGKEGEDFTARMWGNGRVGVLFGTWQIAHVSDGAGGIDRNKLNAAYIKSVCPQPANLPFTDRWLSPAKTFLIDVASGDRVLVTFGGAVHIGEVSDEFVHDPSPRGPMSEYFKCRRLRWSKTFLLSELPSVYRLINTTGQGTIQRILALEAPVRLLDACESAATVCHALGSMTPEQLLEMLSPEQWEVVCGEYLRDQIGFRFLLLNSGKTLKDVDLIGIDRSHRRVIAQCKNDAKPWSARSIDSWLAATPAGPADTVYFFCRGGVRGIVNPRCVVVDGAAVADWLRRSPDYFRCLKEF